MRELERRLLDAGGGGALLLVRSGALGVLGALLLVAQAALLAHVIVAAFLGHARPQAVAGPLAWLLLVIFSRALLAFLLELNGRLFASRVKSSLRSRLASHLLQLGPDRLDEESTGDLVTTLVDGVEALDAYFARYLPQLVLAVAVPCLLIGWVVLRDPLSALILALTVPLIPLFMALVGLAAEATTRRRWKALSILSAHFLDVLQGLPTLRVFGRAHAQAESIRKVTDQYRRTTLANLRVAFLSSLVLELAATIGTALVAVAIGVRLAEGGLGLEPGLAVLILAPEVYLPLRRLGAQYHASLDALAPAERLFALLDERPPLRDGTLDSDLARQAIEVRSAVLGRPGRGPVLEGANLTVLPGERIAVVGASGAGKTTLLELLAGFLQPERGQVLVGGVSLSALDWRCLLSQVGWVPQRPAIFEGSLAENIRLGDPDASPAAVERAARRAGLDLPLENEAGERGSRLSAGQRQRVALARALVRRPRLLLLDEPAANLDPESTRRLADLLRGLDGTTVVMAVHTPALAAGADRVLRLEGGRLHSVPA